MIITVVNPKLMLSFINCLKFIFQGHFVSYLFDISINKLLIKELSLHCWYCL